MSKYELLPEQLIHEGTIETQNLFEPNDATTKEIIGVHDISYWQRLDSLQLTEKEIRRTGFPLSKELIEREVNIMGGTIACVDFAFKYGISMNIAGGTHHAYRNKGEGFCLLNDQAIAAQNLLDRNLAKQILIIDLDVHQGNGTASIFKNDPRIFTFSMHGDKNYPMHKESSDLDIGLADGCSDDFYLNTLDANLKNLLEQVQPDFLFYQCGVDILESDRLGRLSITLDGCKQRDRLVLELAHEHELPIVASMGGGYSHDLNTIVEAHSNTFRLAQEIYF